MKYKTLWKRVLSSAIALVMAAGTLFVSPAKVADAATVNTLTNGDFEAGNLTQGQSGATITGDIVHSGNYAAKVNEGATLQFTTDNVNGGKVLEVNTSYTFSMWVLSEAEASIQAWIVKTNKDWTNIDDKVVESVNVVPNTWTKLEYTFTTGDFEMVLQPRISGTADFYIDDMVLRKTKQTELSLRYLDIDEDGNWLFERSELSDDLLGKYQTEFYIDGEQHTVWMEFLQNETYVYAGALGKTPEGEMRIPEGSVLREYSTDTWTEVPDGKQLILTDCMYAVKDGDEWKNDTFIATAGLVYNKVDDKGNWWFDSNPPEDYAVSGVFWRTEVLVDGTETIAWIEVYGGNAYIYPHCIMRAPTESLEIPAETVLYEATALSDIIAGGRTITVDEGVKVVKKDGNWVVEHVCKAEYVSPVEATCTTDGTIAHYECSCGKLYTDEACTDETTKEATTLSALGHKTTYVAEKAATCTATGTKAYYSCSACGKKYEDEACTKELTNITIAKKNHSIKYVAEKAATCTKDGYKEYYTCSTCKKIFTDSKGTTETKISPLKKHTVKNVKEVKATYTKEGMKAHYKCSCGKLYTDKDCKKATTKAKLTIPVKKLTVAKTSVKKVTAKSKALAITWTKKSGVTGYEVQVALKKNFKSGLKKTTVKGASKTSVTVKKLNAKKTYYVRIRAYKKVEGKTFYSAWSSVKSQKTK